MRTSSKLKYSGIAEHSSDHVDLLFLSERCVVSEAASQLMALVHQTLQVSKPMDSLYSSE